MAPQFGSRFDANSRNRERAIIAAASAIVLALSGGAALWASTIKTGPAELVEAVNDATLDPMVSVLVPIRDIDEGQPLTPDLFREERRPVQYLKIGTIRSVEEIKNRYALSPLLEGEPLVSKRVTATRRFSPISPRITKDKSAVTIRVDDLNSASGMLRPGELVDVAWVHSLKNQQAISLIVRSAPVLAADQQVEGEFRPGMPVPGTITLLVPLEDALQIQLAARTGALTLALRGPEASYDPEADTPITYDSLAKGATPLEPKALDCRGKLTVHGEKFCVMADGSLERAA